MLNASYLVSDDDINSALSAGNKRYRYGLVGVGTKPWSERAVIPGTGTGTITSLSLSRLLV